MSADPVESAAKRGLAYLIARPGIAFEFNILSKPGQFPPFIIPANQPAKDLDAAFSGKEGFSGAVYAFAFGAFLNKVEEAGGSVRPDWTSGKMVIKGPAK